MPTGDIDCGKEDAMKNIVNVVFDYDGTLHQALKIFAPAFRKACVYLEGEGLLKRKQWKEEEIAPWLGQTSQAMWQDFYPTLTGYHKTKAEKIIGSTMLSLIEEGSAVLYPKGLKVLEALKDQGYRLFILSNCHKDYLEAHRKHFELDRFITAYYPGEAFGFIPKHEVMGILLGDYPGSTLMVGDRWHDIEAARVHGLPSLGCRYGYGKKEEMDEADQTINELEQLPATLYRIEEEWSKR